MNNKETIVILGGSIVKDNNQWRTTNFSEKDNFGATGDRLRIIAAKYLYKNSENQIIVLGGMGQLKGMVDAQPVSKIIKNELIELGLPKEKIIIEEKSSNTYEQLQELKSIVRAHNITKLEIISNKYHLPRVETLIKMDSDLLKMLNLDKIKLVSAEEICLEHDPKRWQEEINKAYESEAMQERIKLEEKGIKQLKEGTYNF